MNRLLIGAPDKTDLLLQLLHENIEAGFLLVDPDGSLAELAADIIPVRDSDGHFLTERVFYFDPADVLHPAGFNVLEGIAPDERHPLAENICAYFGAMWPDGWGARSNYILLNCLRLLLDMPGSTLLGIPKLLSDDDYRTRALDRCHDRYVTSFWKEEFEKQWDEKFRREAIAPLQNKIGALLTSPMLRNIIGQQKSTFSLGAGKIVIANLDRNKLGAQTSFLLGSLLIARSSGTVFINNLGFYGSDHLADLLSQERFTVAVRFLDDLPKKLQQIVLGIEEKYVYTTTAEDARRLMFSVDAQNERNEIVYLAPGKFRTHLGKEGEANPPESLGRLCAIRRHSRTPRFTPGREVVERDIDRFLEAPKRKERSKPKRRPRPATDYMREIEENLS